jgi:glycerate kinase
MKVNIYSDKFSGTLSASEVLGIIKSVFKNSDIQAKFFPVTDGGEGSTEIFQALQHANISNSYEKRLCR